MRLLLLFFFFSFFLSLSCGNSENGKGDMAVLPAMNAVCDDTSTRLPDLFYEEESVPAYRHYDGGVATNVPQEPSLVDVVPQEIAESLVAGIDIAFLARNSQDRGVLESLQASVESQNSSLSEAASNMVCIINCVEPDRATPYTFDCQQ